MKLYKEHNQYSFIGLGLGIASVFLWMIPIAGLVTSIACLIFVYLGLDTANRKPAVFAMVLGIIGLLLTFLRSGLVVLFV